MAKVYRVFVEKKKGNDIEAGQILEDLRGNVGLTGLEDLRIINRYDAQGLSDAEFDSAVKQVFSETNLDNVYYDLKIDDGWKYFATEYLPGQYDQRADSAAQCIQLLTAGERPKVASAKVIAVKGDISDDEFEKIKSYIINPVESRVASMELPETLDIKTDVPADIVRIDGFIEMSDDEIAAYHGSMGLAMSVADLCWVRDYFKNDEKRNPSLTEIKVIDTYWSDHCRHTTFATQLDEITINEGKYSAAIERRSTNILRQERTFMQAEPTKSFALWIWRASAQNISKNTAMLTTSTRARKSMPAQSMLMLKLTAKKSRGLFSLKTKHTTTRQKSSRSAARQPASAAQSATRFRAEHMFTKQCA